MTLLETPSAVRRRFRRVEVRATPDEGDGTFAALVNDYTADAYDIGWGWKERVQPGAFAASILANPVIPINFEHDWAAGPIGAGTPVEQESGLYVAGQLYLGTDPKVDRIYRAMCDGAVNEWSIGFIALTMLSDAAEPYTDIIQSGDLIEASVVYRGANPSTGTLQLNSKPLAELVGDEPEREREVIRIRSAFHGDDLRERAAEPVHHTETSTAAWDGPEQEANLSNDDGADVYKEAFAWVNPDKDADTKAAYSFIHHFVSADGKVGDASTVACSSGIGVLNGGRGGSSDADWWGDREGIFKHLAAHLTDAGLTPPELKDTDSNGDVKSDSAPSNSFAALGRALSATLRYRAMRQKVAFRDAAEPAPTAADLAQALDAVIDAIGVALDGEDAKGASDLAVAADATSDALLAQLNVPDDDGIEDLFASILGSAFDDTSPTGPGDADWRSADEAAVRSLLTDNQNGWEIFAARQRAASSNSQSPQ